MSKLTKAERRDKKLADLLAEIDHIVDGSDFLKERLKVMLRVAYNRGKLAE